MDQNIWNTAWNYQFNCYLARPPGLRGPLQPPSQHVAPIPQSLHSPFHSPTALNPSMHMRMSSTPDAVQSNDPQRSSPPSSSVHGDRPLSASPPAATSSLSPKITNLAGAPSFAPPRSTIGFTKPAISSAQSSLFFPHLTPAATSVLVLRLSSVLSAHATIKWPARMMRGESS